MVELPEKLTGTQALGRLNTHGYRRVYHFHIRKTAGTSLNSAFWGLAGLDLSTLGQPSVVTRNGYTFIRHDPRAIAAGNYFFANSHHPAHMLQIPPGTFTITVVRSPQERLLSLYRYLSWVRNDTEARTREVYWQAVYQESAWIGASFDEFLDRIPRPDLMPQLHMFSASYDIDEALEQIRNCSAILFTERFSDGISRLADKLGLPLQEKHERRFGQDVQIRLTAGEQERLNHMLADEITFVERLRNRKDNMFKA